MSETMRLSVSISATSAEFERAMGEAGRELDAFKRKAQAAGTAATLMGRNTVLGAGASLNAIHLNALQLQNMQFQLQDIAISLASGQSPFRVMAQQGSQIVQIFGPRTGVRAALKAVGAGIVQFVSNPLNIALVAITAAAGAASLLANNLFRTSDAAKRNGDDIKTLADAMDALDQATGRANRSQEERVRLAQNATRELLAENVATARAAQLRLEAEISRAMRPGAGVASDVGAIGALNAGRLEKQLTQMRKEAEAAQRSLNAAMFRQLSSGFIDPADPVAPIRLKYEEGIRLLEAEAEAAGVTPDIILRREALERAYRREAAAAREAAKETKTLAKVETPPLIEELGALLGERKDRIAKIVEETRTPLERLRSQFAEIEALKPFARSAQELEALARAQERVQEQMAELQENVSDFGRLGEEAGRGLADSFAAAIAYGERLDRTLARLAQRLAFDALRELFIRALPGVFGGLSGFAGGGRINGPALVGERGPELIVPQRPATVVNAADTRRALGGPNVIVNQTIAPNFAGNAATQDDLRLMSQITREAAIAGTMAALRRPRFA